MDAAVAGLLGTVIGGAITAVTSIVVEFARVGARGRKERRTRLATLRTAVRLLDMQFRVHEMVLKTQIEGKYWTKSVKTAPLEMQVWPRYATELASDLSHDAWTSVTIGILAHGEVVAFAAREEGPLTKDEIEKLEMYLKLVREARKAISVYLETGEAQSTRRADQGVLKQGERRPGARCAGTAPGRTVEPRSLRRASPWRRSKGQSLSSRIRQPRWTSGPPKATASPPRGPHESTSRVASSTPAAMHAPVKDKQAA
jgi:hypothetical protein